MVGVVRGAMSAGIVRVVGGAEEVDDAIEELAHSFGREGLTGLGFDWVGV